MFGQYYLQAINFIKSKIYKPFVRQTGKKTPENLCIILFDKDMRFLNIARISRDTFITSSLPIHP